MVKNKGQIIATSYYAYFLNGIITLLFSILMPIFQEDLGISYKFVGTLLSSYYLGNMVSSFSFGFSAVKIGRRMSISIVLVLSIIAMIILIISRSPILYLLAFFFTGLGRGGKSNMGNMLVNEASGGNPAYLNILHGVFGLGAFLGPIFISVGLNNGLSEKIIIGLVAIMLFILLVLYQIVPYNNYDQASKDLSQSTKSIDFSYFKDLGFILTGLIIFFYCGVETAVNGWMITYLKDSGIFSQIFAQRILSIMWLLLTLSRFIGAWLSTKVKDQTILLFSSLACLISYILFMATDNKLVLVASIGALGLFMGPIYPTAINNGGKVLQESDIAMSLIVALGGLSGALMPSIVGIFSEKFALKGGMATVALVTIFLFLSSLFNYIIKNKREKMDGHL